MNGHLRPWRALRRRLPLAGGLLAMLASVFPSPAVCATAYLVGDADTGEPGAFFGDAGPAVPLGSDRVLFVTTASDLHGSPTLWVADAGDTGAKALLSFDRFGWTLELVGSAGEVGFFLVRDDRSRTWSWRTDGTEEGTWELRSAAGERVAVSFDIGRESLPYAVTESRLFAIGCAQGGCDVWRTDDVGATLEPVGALASPPITGHPLEISSANGRVWWTIVTDGEYGLGMLDETSGDVVRLVPLPFVVEPGLLQASGSLAFLGSAELDEEIWVSDGTIAEAQPVTSFEAASVFSSNAWLAPSARGVHFVVDDVIHGFELWESDGTPEGTNRITDFGYSGALHLVAQTSVFLLGDRYVFLASDGVSHVGVWSARSHEEAPVFLGRTFEPIYAVGPYVLFLNDEGLHSTDGTSEGTATILPCPCPFGFQELRVVDDLLHYSVGATLWRTDGTVAGTIPLVEFPRSISVDPRVVAVGNALFVRVAEPFYGSELWRVLPDRAPTPVADASKPTLGVNPTELVPLVDRVLFSGCTLSRSSVFVGDARIPEVRQLSGPMKPSCPGPGDEPLVITTAADFGFFLEDAPFQGSRRLWRTDGATASGTRLLLELASGSIEHMVALDSGVALFVRQEGELAIWLSNGTESGTSKAVDVSDFWSLWSARGLGEKMLFVASRGGLPPELWVFDSASRGLEMLRELGDLGVAATSPLVRVGDRVLQLANFEGDVGFLVTDGTKAGTRLIRQSPEVSRTFLSAPVTVVEHGGELYYTVWSSLFGFEPPELEIRKLEPDLDSGPRIFGPVPVPDDVTLLGGRELVSDGTRLWFVAEDAEHGAELWTSNGDAESTRLVLDLWPGPLSSDPKDLVAIGEQLFFTASTAPHGRELFRSDGSAASTRMIHDIWPGAQSSEPSELVVAGEFLYFAANDGLTGRELWALPLVPQGGCLPGANWLCLGDRFRVEAVWRDFEGGSGRGFPRALTADTGYFWFFDEDNVEIALKVLDARAVNDHFWVYSGALSNVEYYLTVTDTETGSTVRYFNPAGIFGSFGDVEALSPHLAVAEPATRSLARSTVAESTIDRRTGKASGEPCQPGAERLCLGGDRFAVEVSWSDGSGGSGVGSAVPLTADTGYFWFFDPANVEVLIKVLDARVVNDRFWVFYGALSDVEYTIRVTDTVTGAVREYHNPSGRFASVGDTEAF